MSGMKGELHHSTVKTACEADFLAYVWVASSIECEQSEAPLCMKVREGIWSPSKCHT